MTSLFVSYSRKDSTFAHQLIDAFQGQDWDFWVDWEDIPLAVDWFKEIEKGIEESGVFLFLLSPDSVKSKYCLQEIEHAAKNGKRLIPVVVHDVNAEEVPPELCKLNWIFIRENDDFQSACEKLFLAVRTDYDWVRAHRQLQLKALEWERNGRDKSFDESFFLYGTGLQANALKWARNKPDESYLLHGTELQLAEFQLTTNASKDPHPTDLQREYVLKSRQAAVKRTRLIMGLAIVIVIAMAALGAFGWYQAVDATKNERSALTQEAIAQTSAVEAKKQANIALARQLAAQAQSMHTSGNPKRELAVLLSVLSMQIFPVIDAAQILQTNVLAYPIAKMTHDGYVVSVAFSPDGKYVVSGSDDSTARVWEALTGKEIARMPHDGYVISVAFSPDGKYVVSGSYDGTARVWEALTGKEIARMTHDGHVLSVAFSPDGKYVVSGSYDDTVRVWEALTGKEIARMTHDSGVNLVAISSDGKYVISTSYDGVRVWETLTGKEIARMKHDGEVNSAAFSPDGKYVVSGSYDDTVRVWETLTGKEIARMTYDLDIWSVVFSPDGKYVVSGCEDGTARVWEIATGKETASMTHDGYVWLVGFSPDGKYGVSGSNDGTARVWEMATGKETARMKHSGLLRSVAFSPDGRYVVSGSEDGIARVWEIATGKETNQLTKDSDAEPLDFSPDGRYEVMGNNDGTVLVREVATGKETALMNYDGDVDPVAFSPDGKYIVSGGCDRHSDLLGCLEGTARVWEALSGKEIARMTYNGDVNSVAFTPDGNHVLSVAYDGTTSVWIYRPEDLIADACMRVTRNLTRKEWNLYIGDILPYQAVCKNLPIEAVASTTPSPAP